MLRTLVITSCTGEKYVKLENQLTQEDFMDPSRLQNREKELYHSRKPAAKMYAGWQHRCLMEGIYKLRSNFKDEVFDIGIVSAGYGLISEKKLIPIYANQVIARTAYVSPPSPATGKYSNKKPLMICR